MTTEDLWTPLHLDDERVREGFARLRSRRDAALAGGSRPAGWKVAMNAPAARQRAGISSSLIGYMVEEGLLPPDAPISVADMKQPGAELELAFHIGRDVPADADRETAAAAIDQVAPAVEIIDIDQERAGDLAEALSRNIWHRAAVLGPARPWSEDLLDTLRVRIGAADGEPGEAVTPRAAIVDAGALVRFVAGATPALGTGLRAGDWILSGMLVPAVHWVAAGDRVRVDHGVLGTMELRFV